VIADFKFKEGQQPLERGKRKSLSSSGEGDCSTTFHPHEDEEIPGWDANEGLKKKREQGVLAVLHEDPECNPRT